MPVTTRIAAVCAAALISVSGAAQAEFAKVNEESQFVELVQGKTLTRPLVKLEVTPQGEIRGTGAAWDVTGNWSWRGGYFCRDLYWGGSELGYNCQEVRVLGNGRSIRFTSDRGAGDYADFRLR